MFDALTGKLQKVFKNLRGMGKISDSNISDSLREVRMALLEADVNFKVVREFIEDIRQKAIGQEVFQSIQPGQQVIKIIHDELVNLLGSTHSNLNLDAVPSCILLCGLHGSGKTTSSGKLARYLTKLGKKPLLVAADVYRPAAMDQLDIIGKQINVPVWVEKGEKNVFKITEHALKHAKEIGANVVIFDTAGRLQIDEPLVQELVQLGEETLLVLPFLPEDFTWAGAIDLNIDVMALIGLDPLDDDAGEHRILQLFFKIAADLHVLDDEGAVIGFGSEPFGVPVAVDADPHPDCVDFMTHSAYFLSATTTNKLALRLMMGEAEPLARGIYRLIFKPSETWISAT